MLPLLLILSFLVPQASAQSFGRQALDRVPLPGIRYERPRGDPNLEEDLRNLHESFDWYMESIRRSAKIKGRGGLMMGRSR